jgi:DNA-binding transcriptional MocR family regulator
MNFADLQRDGGTSITQQLVERFEAAIESGELAPGEKLPPTRRLAEDAGINHLTAARVYRRLAEDGYVTASVGRGTFVRALTPAASAEAGDDWQTYVLPDRVPTYQEEVLSDSFRRAREEGMISLATGFPSPRFHPTEQLAEITAEVFVEVGSDAIAYLNPEGLPELREEIAAGGRKYGFATSADEIVVTSGGQQAIDLVARATLEPGDVAVIESPTFVGSIQAIRATGARVIGVPVDRDGMDVSALEQVLARHEVKLVAIQTACQNPTGVDLSPERRTRLIELARERNFFILEDGVYAALRYEGEPTKALRAEAPGHVLHVNSLSKVVGGGLRVGWVAGRGPVLDRLTMLKQGNDFHTSTLTQHISARFLATDYYRENLERSLPYYRERRDVLCAAVEHHLAGEVRIERPRGGHHLWVTLERPCEERSFYAEAVRHGVAFTPGGAVTVDRRGPTTLRLSFSLLEPEDLEEGVKRLARALREVRRSARSAVAAPLS